MKNRLIAILRWSEKYTKTDMVYLVESNFWLQSSSLFVSIASFLLYVIFANVLPKDVYGTYQYFLSLGAIVTACTMTGMSSAVTRAVARGFEGTFRASIRVQLLWGIVPLVGAWAAGTYYLVHGNATLGFGLILLGVFIPLSTTFNTFTAYLTAKRDFRRGFFYGLIINIPYYASVALVAVSIPTALALLTANLAAQAIGYAIAYRRTVSAYRPVGPSDPDAVRYGTHLSLINLLGSVVSQVDAILVFHLLGAANLALYSFVTAIPDRLGIFKGISVAAFPKYATKTRNEIRTSLGRKLVMSFLVSAVIITVYVAFAHPFFAFFFPRYLDAVPYSQAYALTILVAFSPLFATALTAHGRTRSLYTLNLIVPVIQLSCVATGIIFFGLWGLVLGRVAGALIASLATLGTFFLVDE